MILFIVLLLSTIITIIYTYENNNIPIVDIIITLKTDLNIVKNCIDSLLKYEPNNNIIKQRIILVDDGSPPETKNYRKYLCKNFSDKFLCGATGSSTNNKTGYTVAVNLGIKLAASKGLEESSSIVLLNSDTIVSDNWLTHLYDTLFHSSNSSTLGIVGPISNAATIQSAPRLYDTDDWGVNSWTTNLPFPAGVNFDYYAREIERFSIHHNLQPVPIEVLNGFCYMFKRSVVNKIGLFDEVHFQKGYGEEEDFSYRASKAGYTSAVVPTVYIFHYKTKSFTNNEKQELKATATKYIFDTYGPRKPNMGKEVTSGKTMTSIREYSSTLLRDVADKYSYINKRFLDGDFIHPANSGSNVINGKNTPSILFVTHSVSMGGGVVSIMQEALQMLEYGLNVAISMPRDCAGGKSMDYIKALLPHTSEETIGRLVRYHSGNVLYPHPVSEDFIDNIAKDYDIIVATFCLTMHAVNAAIARYPHIMPAYYVQDYEPWFWVSPFGGNSGIGDHESEARNSYNSNNNKNFIISKTRWTANMVTSHHNITVHKVIPSLDHTIYYPNKTIISNKFKKNSNNIFHVLAMIRPRTPRRNPEMTIEVITKLIYNNNNIKVTLIGCNENELLMSLNSLIKIKGITKYRNNDYLLKHNNVQLLGVLYERSVIADLYRNTDIFLDLSWWQAFGRAGLESMACGVVAIMPLTGAAPEICKESFEHCLYHDGMDPDGVYDKVMTVIGNDSLRHDLIRKGMQRSRHFSIELAAASIANELTRGLIGYRAKVQ